MKKFLICFFALVFSFSIIGTGNADLTDNGGNLIYDSALGITWYAIPNDTYGLLPDVANGSVPAANTWAAGLNIGGVSGWRLPSTPGTSDGYTSEGEMGQLRLELGNNPGDPLANAGYFTFLIGQNPSIYWTTYKTVPSISPYGPGPWDNWVFNFSDGGYSAGPNYDFAYALAVHEGDYGPNGPITPGGPPSGVPEPATMLLLGLGLVGIAGIRRKFKI